MTPRRPLIVPPRGARAAADDRQGVFDATDRQRIVRLSTVDQLRTECRVGPAAVVICDFLKTFPLLNYSP
jgi:hypothetical protein